MFVTDIFLNRYIILDQHALMYGEITIISSGTTANPNRASETKLSQPSQIFYTCLFISKDIFITS